jgi:hypothetical protein
LAGWPQDMLDYEDKLIATRYKFGILYCRANQSIEDQMYNNGNPRTQHTHAQGLLCVV